MQDYNDSNHTNRLKRVYEMAIKSRELEIQNLTSRNNFFMIFQGVLLAGILQAQGQYSKALLLCTCLLGLSVSICQMFTAAGAKFWQSRWEQKVADTELKLLFNLGGPKYFLFADDEYAAKFDVEKNMGRRSTVIDLSDYNNSPVKQIKNKSRNPITWTADFLILQKFSVGKSPIYVGMTLSIFWFTLFLHSFSLNIDFIKNIYDSLAPFVDLNENSLILNSSNECTTSCSIKR